MFSVLNTFLRMRFPQEHFDRLNGLNAFMRFLSSPFQYFLFLWIQDNKNQAITHSYLVANYFYSSFSLIIQKIS
ncbi:hypothetical protein Anas_04401 [Armadillidium nasatum]|uniref:Uncharacterized protein n=1 Tax=Armadillidium nasatum TaxID=96803 RepID=A0A5N5TNE0_9CRUS|nr:hypothetical protein Anas_04401 [Armadillidium nasatum]